MYFFIKKFLRLKKQKGERVAEGDGKRAKKQTSSPSLNREGVGGGF